MNALFIKNVKDEFLPAFKELVKISHANLTIQSDKQKFISTIKSDLNAYAKGELDCLSMQECESAMQDFMDDLAKKYAR